MADMSWFARRLRDLGLRISNLESVAHSHRLEHVTTGATAGTDWSLTAFDAWTSRLMCVFLVELVRLNTDVVSPDSVNEGNLINVTVATLPTSCRGTLTIGQPITSGSIGRGLFGTYIADSGLVRLNASSSGDDILVGESITLGGTVILNP